MGTNENRRTNVVPATVWVALVLGSVVSWIVPIGSGRDINVALFDVALPLSVALRLATGHIVVRNLPCRLYAGIAIAAVLVLGHAAFTYRYGAWRPISRLEVPIQLAGLLRETLKLETVLVEFAMLLALFSAADMRRPPAWLLATMGLMISGYIIYDRIEFLHENVPYFANVVANSLAGLMVLAVSLIWSNRSRDRLAALAWSTGAMLVMMVAIRKTYLIVCAVVVVSIVLAAISDAARHSDGKQRKQIVLFFAGSLVIVVSAHTLMTLTFYEGRNVVDVLLAATSHSADVRFDIQLVAWHLLLVSFPIGIGIGQFGALVPHIPEIADYRVAFAHNTILTLVMEMGLVGIAVSAALVVLVYLACRGSHWVPRLSRLVFFSIPAILNDTHGLRMTILVLAFFVAGHYVKARDR